MIVVAIILIIAAIAIPNLLRARTAANQSAAAGAIATINVAQVSYFNEYPTQGYANLMLVLGPPALTGCSAAVGPTVASACLIDWGLANATTVATAKSGYIFGITNAGGGPPFIQYTVSAAPATWNQTGVKGYCSNEDGVLHYNPSYNGSPSIINTVCASIAWPQL